MWPGMDAHQYADLEEHWCFRHLLFEDAVSTKGSQAGLAELGRTGTHHINFVAQLRTESANSMKPSQVLPTSAKFGQEMWASGAALGTSERRRRRIRDSEPAPGCRPVGSSWTWTRGGAENVPTIR